MELEPRVLIIGIAVIVFVAALGFVFTGDNSSRAAKRAQSLSGNARTARAKTANQDQAKDRRKQVQDSLKKIEEKQKELKKKQGRVTLEQAIEQAGYEMSVKEFYMVSGIVGLIFVAIGVVSGQAPLVILAMGVVGTLGLPRWFIGRAKKKRQKKFVDEFSNSIDVIVRGVKSGLPVNECLKIIAKDAQSPVKEEFYLLTEGIRIGLSLEQSLERMYSRMPVNEVNFFAIVLVIQQQTGGNLADALGNLSTVLRSRKTMLGKIAALSMEAKASAVILAAMPFFVSGLVYLSAPDYLEPIYTTPTGQFMLIAAGVWMMIGVFVMKNMISIKV